MRWHPFRAMISGAAAIAALFATIVHAEMPDAARMAEIIVLGELHDNPAHHARQAEWVHALAPKALVFEMLTPQQAARAAGGWRTQAELDAAVGWTGSPWPSFDYYFPIFAAAPDAVIYGAGVPRADLMAQMEAPLDAHPLAAEYGIGQPLDAGQQAARIALQAEAHCGALPEEILPMMVDAQRLRDAALADAALRALRHTGGPVAVITGNGHARTDWGMPAMIARAAPETRVFALGQSEEGGAVAGTFNLTLDAPAPDRGDPCSAFSQ